MNAWINKKLDAYLSGKLFSWRQIRSLMIPSILDCMSITLLNMLTTALISKNGAASVAAVSLVGPITGLAMCFFQGLGDGGSVLIAQCAGKKTEDMLERCIATIIWLNALTCILFCVPFILFAEPIIHTLYPSLEGIVSERACVYLAGCSFTIPLYAMYSAFFRVLRGLGESKRTLFLSIVINSAYLVFSFLYLNILRMDIIGSVYALLTARIIGLSCAVVALFFWRPPVRMKLRHFLTFDRHLILPAVRISFPFALERICADAGNLAFQMIMSSLGTATIAIRAIANSMLGVLYSPATAMAHVSVAVVGRCVGAGIPEEAYRYGKRCCQIALLLLLAASAVFFPLMPMLLAQYDPSAEATVMVPRLLLSCLPCLFLFWPMSNTYPSVLRACGDSLYPTVTSISVLWVMNIGFGYILAVLLDMGLWGVWISAWLGWIVQGLILSARFRSRKWTQKSLFKTAK